MTYFPDLTPYKYLCPTKPQRHTFNIGWLSKEFPYDQGESPAEFKQRLAFFCESPSTRFMTAGMHTCEFCGQAVGSTEIRIIAGKKSYAAPVLVFHYVDAHRYRPPQEFIDAVLKAPLPDSVKMRRRFGPPFRY